MSQVLTKAGMSRVLSVVMGGGQGARLFPLTLERSKPAVPLAGKYRLVDIPISNCINSRLNEVYLLTQFNSASLHRHISHSYKFDHFSRGFVEILAAEQTPKAKRKIQVPQGVFIVIRFSGDRQNRRIRKVQKAFTFCF